MSNEAARYELTHILANRRGDMEDLIESINRQRERLRAAEAQLNRDHETAKQLAETLDALGGPLLKAEPAETGA